MKKMISVGLAVFCCVVASADMAPLPRHGRDAAPLMKAPPLTVSVAGLAGSAIIDLQGGRVLSWKTTTGTELLFMPRQTESPDGDWSHGGISVCWPWFGKKGDTASSIHGFARNRRFAVRRRGSIEGGGSFVTLGLTLAAGENPDFPFAAELELTFRMTDRFEVMMRTTNTGDKPFSFSEGIQPYFAVPSATRALSCGRRGMSNRTTATLRLATPSVSSVWGRVAGQRKGPSCLPQANRTSLSIRCRFSRTQPAGLCDYSTGTSRTGCGTARAITSTASSNGCESCLLTSASLQK